MLKFEDLKIPKATHNEGLYNVLIKTLTAKQAEAIAKQLGDETLPCLGYTKCLGNFDNGPCYPFDSVSQD